MNVDRERGPGLSSKVGEFTWEGIRISKGAASKVGRVWIEWYGLEGQWRKCFKEDKSINCVKCCGEAE